MCCVIKKWTGPSLDSAVGQFGFKSGLGHYVVLGQGTEISPFSSLLWSITVKGYS